MKNKGFTLVELLAVIVIIGILLVITGVSVSSIIRSSNDKTKDLVRKNLEDAALTYALDKLNINSICAVTYNLTDAIDLSLPSGCPVKVTVKTIKDNGFFKDEKKVCNENTNIIIYRYTSTINGKKTYDLRAYVPENTCK